MPGRGSAASRRADEGGEEGSGGPAPACPAGRGGEGETRQMDRVRRRSSAIVEYPVHGSLPIYLLRRRSGGGAVKRLVRTNVVRDEEDVLPYLPGELMRSRAHGPGGPESPSVSASPVEQALRPPRVLTSDGRRSPAHRRIGCPWRARFAGPPVSTGVIAEAASSPSWPTFVPEPGDYPITTATDPGGPFVAIAGL